MEMKETDGGREIKLEKVNGCRDKNDGGEG